MSHIAIVRSSARMAQQRANESQKSQPSNSNQKSNDQLSHSSVVSISSSEDDILHNEDSRKQRSRVVSDTMQSTKSSTVKGSQSQRFMKAPLDQLSSFSDIEACLDSDLSQIETITRLEEQWHSIMFNLEFVLDHLQDCSDQVTEASNNCLQSLVDSIETTCDSVDHQVKALYHLMTKCDELTTKLSAAGSFRDEIKTLRKSVDTLENLYKSRPHTNLQGPANRAATSA